MPTNKTYTFRTFEQMLNVINDENIECLTLDLAKWLASYNECIKQIRAQHPESTAGKTNWEICQTTFGWIDDGKTDLKYIDHHNTTTGEVTRIKVKLSKDKPKSPTTTNQHDTPLT